MLASGNMDILLPTDREMLRKNWGWFMALGAVIMLLGIIGLFMPLLFTLGTVVFVGWLFMISGVAEVVHAIVRKGWSGFWGDLLSGLISLAAGVLIVLWPVDAASVLTLIIGVMFLVGGIFRVALGVTTKSPYGVWIILHGVISTLLGLMIVAQWPFDTVWVIGTLVAIDLILNGSRMISLGATARNIPPATVASPDPV